ncbi:hypothetical protein DFQ26_004447 [Actinomortierella ambigua]|nr:hypothetical protein DFQ26_004447 [Actinomortierella ambigua]
MKLISSQIAIGTSLILRHPFSPTYPSWPLHLALFVACFRATADHQDNLGDDVADVRLLVDTFFYYLPRLPTMTIEPFTFPVPKGGRGFGGVLAPLEACEDGHRTIPGAWISDSRVWNRVMAMPLAYSARFSQDPYAARQGEKVILYFHGGAYFICTVDYRLAPEYTFPAPIQDAAHAYAHLTDPHGLGFEPENVTIAGDSAGGGLSLGSLMYLRDQGITLPSKGVLFSPWLDLTCSSESWTTNHEFDYLPGPAKPTDKFHPVAMYCGGMDRMRTLRTHPYVSPLFGSLHGLPPLLIQVGDAERLRDECILLVHKAGGNLGPPNKLPPSIRPWAMAQQQQHQQQQQQQKQSSTSSSSSSSWSQPIELDLYPRMVHVFQAFPLVPEAITALQRMRHFMEAREAEEAARQMEMQLLEKLARELAERLAYCLGEEGSTISDEKLSRLKLVTV